MRSIPLFLFVLSLVGLVSPAYAKGFHDGAKSGAELMKKMIGEWEIEGRIRSGPAAEFASLNGRSTIVQHYSPGQIKEVFVLGGSFKGEVYLNHSEAHERFELFQIDMNSSRGSAVFLTGEFSDSRLKFKGFENYAQWGIKPALDIRWEYVFFEDGTFTHEIYLKDPKGEFFLQSDYHYTKAKR